MPRWRPKVQELTLAARAHRLQGLCPCHVPAAGRAPPWAVFRDAARQDDRLSSHYYIGFAPTHGAVEGCLATRAAHLTAGTARTAGGLDTGGGTAAAQRRRNGAGKGGRAQGRAARAGADAAKQQVAAAAQHCRTQDEHCVLFQCCAGCARGRDQPRLPAHAGACRRRRRRRPQLDLGSRPSIAGRRVRCSALAISGPWPTTRAHQTLASPRLLPRLGGAHAPRCAS